MGWIGQGDVYTPWCCFPFCMLAGRKHLYSDEGILQIYHNTVKNKQGWVQQAAENDKMHLTNLMMEMNLVEGMSSYELEELLNTRISTRGGEGIRKLLDSSRVPLLAQDEEVEDHIKKQREQALRAMDKLREEVDKLRAAIASKDAKIPHTLGE